MTRGIDYAVSVVAKDQVADYSYDARNRLDFVNYNNGHTRDYVYDDG